MAEKDTSQYCSSNNRNIYLGKKFVNCFRLNVKLTVLCLTTVYLIFFLILQRGRINGYCISNYKIISFFLSRIFKVKLNTMRTAFSFSSSPIYVIKPRMVQLRETLRYIHISRKTKSEIFFPLSGVA